MADTHGFLKIDRQLPQTYKPQERIKHYDEFYKPHDEQLTKEQASRCMDCGVPFCHQGCPLGNFIPDFNDAVYKGNWKKAVNLLLQTNNFPEFTGRICPAPCEGSCVLGINKNPVAIEHIEKTIIEKAFELGYIKPQLPQERIDKKVAIIGSGPAGLAAADQLNKVGYHITVFERHEKPGGLLRFGIPDFKLSKKIVQRRIDLMQKEGIVFKTKCNVGVDISVDNLKKEFDAILLSGGSTIPRDIPIKGRKGKGVHFAMEFLTQQNKRVSQLSFQEEDILAKDKNVIVIGGGDTGSDCVGTSVRQGAKSITQFELLSRPPFTRTQTNPWPEWPLILRTSSSHEEGSERKWSILTKEFILDENKHIKALKTVDVKWEGKNFVEIAGTEKEYPCELVLIAAGFLYPQKEGLLEQLQIKLDDRNNVLTKNYATSTEYIFSAGDMRRGQSLVVWAISEGREVANAIDKYLSNTTKSKLFSIHESKSFI